MYLRTSYYALISSLFIGFISCSSWTASGFFSVGLYHSSMSSIVCGSGRCKVSGSNRLSRPAAVDRPPNSRPGNHGSSFAYVRQHQTVGLLNKLECIKHQNNRTCLQQTRYEHIYSPFRQTRYRQKTDIYNAEK